MVKRTVKYSLGLLALVVIALVIAPFFIDANSYKPQIVKAVKDATGRTVQIGNIEASVFPWVGIRLEDVHLANRMGFSDRDFLKVESLDVQVALLPLLSKEVEIKRFQLDAPELFLERNADGQGNWEDLTSTNQTATVTAPATAKEQESSALAALNAEALLLNHGRFVWSDAVSKAGFELSDVKVSVTDVQVERPIALSISARIGGDEVGIQAQVGPLGDLSNLNAEKLPLQATLVSEALGLRSFKAWVPELPEVFGRAEDAKVKLNVQLEQRPDGIRLSIGEASLLAKTTAQASWKVEMADARKVQLQKFDVGLNGQNILSAQGDIKLGDTLYYQLRVKGEAVSRTWLASLLPDLTSLYAAHPAPWKQVSFGAMIAGDTERLELRDVQLMLDKEMLQLSGVAAFGKAPDVRLRLTAAELHMDPWLPQPQEQKGAPASVESELNRASTKAEEPDLRAFKEWRISSQLQVEMLHLRGLELGHLRATINGNRGLFQLDPLRFDLAGGQVTEKASLDIASYPARWTESVHMTGVNVGPVLRSLAEMDMLEGVLQMDTEMKATGLLPENSMNSMGGKGKVVLVDGSVKGFDIAGTMRNLTSLGQGSGPKKTDFAQLQAGFTIKDGVVKNDDLFMASPLFRLTGNGIVNLPKGSLDYHVKPRLVGTLTGQGDTVTVRKGLAVPLRIRGPFNSPRITPEVDPATLIENIGAIQSGGALKGVKEALGGKTPAAPADQKPTPEKAAKKALEGLIKGL